MGEKSNVFSHFTKRIILYEPEEVLYNKLRLRFRGNDNILINNLIVSDKAKETLFYSIPGNEAYSSIIKNYKKDFIQLNKSKVIKKKKDVNNFKYRNKKIWFTLLYKNRL